MTRQERIYSALRDALGRANIAIADESHLHVGHAGARPEGETHYRVDLVSEAFEGQSKVQRQRMVYRLLGDEFATGLHALSLSTLTPAEADAQER